MKNQEQKISHVAKLGYSIITHPDNTFDWCFDDASEEWSNEKFILLDYVLMAIEEHWVNKNTVTIKVVYTPISCFDNKSLNSNVEKVIHQIKKHKCWNDFERLMIDEFISHDGEYDEYGENHIEREEFIIDVLNDNYEDNYLLQHTLDDLNV